MTKTRVDFDSLMQRLTALRDEALAAEIAASEECGNGYADMAGWWEASSIRAMLDRTIGEMHRGRARALRVYPKLGSTTTREGRRE